MGVQVFPADVAFELRDTHGLPFDLLFECLYRRMMVVDCRALIKACMARGWNERTAVRQVADAWHDVYPRGRQEFIAWADGPESLAEGMEALRIGTGVLGGAR